jgi:hypothetical protein
MTTSETFPPTAREAALVYIQRGHDQVASVRLLVRHCKQKNQEWRIGCQFMEELPWSVLLLFG